MRNVSFLLWCGAVVAAAAIIAAAGGAVVAASLCSLHGVFTHWFNWLHEVVTEFEAGVRVRFIGLDQPHTQRCSGIVSVEYLPVQYVLPNRLFHPCWLSVESVGYRISYRHALQSACLSICQSVCLATAPHHPDSYADAMMR